MSDKVKQAIHVGRHVTDIMRLDCVYSCHKEADGTRKFVQSFKTEEQANRRRDYLTADWKEGTYIVEPSDINISTL